MGMWLYYFTGLEQCNCNIKSYIKEFELLCLPAIKRSLTGKLWPSTKPETDPH